MKYSFWLLQISTQQALDEETRVGDHWHPKINFGLFVSDMFSLTLNITQISRGSSWVLPWDLRSLSTSFCLHSWWTVCIFQHFYSFMRCRWDHYGGSRILENHKKNEELFPQFVLVARNFVFYGYWFQIRAQLNFCFGSKQCKQSPCLHDPFFVCFTACDNLSNF